MRALWWLLLFVIVISGVISVVIASRWGLNYYVKAWIYTKAHPESQVMFRAEKKPLTRSGIYIDYQEGMIRLWRNWRIESYLVGDRAEILVYKGCDAPDYDESKLKEIAVEAKEELGNVARKGDFAVVTVDSLDTKNVGRVLVTDYWLFVKDTRLEEQCHARNL